MELKLCSVVPNVRLLTDAKDIAEAVANDAARPSAQATLVVLIQSVRCLLMD